MKSVTQVLWRDNYARLGLQATTLFWFSTLILLLISWSKIPPELPLFYSRPWGEDQLAPNLSFLIPPLGILSMSVLTFLVSPFLSEEKFLIYILIFTNVLCSILVFLAFINIFLLVVY